jgi:predicted GIY-YIG superfamily endonuclease
MPDYKNGKLYKLQCDDGYYYIGSTCDELRYRLNGHKKDSRKHSTPLYQHINEIGWDRVRIVLIEECPCENKQQLVRKEDEMIQLNLMNDLCLNTRRAVGDRKQLLREYYLTHKDQINEYKREWRRNKSRQDTNGIHSES